MCAIGKFTGNQYNHSCYYFGVINIFVIIPLVIFLISNVIFFKNKYLSYKFSLIIIALSIIQFLFIWLLRVYMG